MNYYNNSNNYRNDRDDLEVHKKSDKIKWIVVFTSLVLLLILVIAALATAAGANGKAEENAEQAEKTSMASGLVVDGIAGQGIRLAGTRIDPEMYAANGVTPLAGDAFTLKATVQPVTASNQGLLWTIDWTDAENEWAADKAAEDYITLSPIGLSCTVTCLQPFAAQATVTCTSEENAEITAACTVDFRERLDEVVFKLTMNDREYTVTDGTEVPNLTSGTANVDITKTIGSIASEYTASVTVSATDEFAAWLENTYGNSYGTGYDNIVSVPLGEFSYGDSFFYDITEPNTWGGQVGMYGQYIYAEIISKVSDGTYSGNVLEFTVTVTGGETPVEFAYECPMGDITIPMGSLSLNESGIVF